MEFWRRSWWCIYLFIYFGCFLFLFVNFSSRYLLYTYFCCMDARCILCIKKILHGKERHCQTLVSKICFSYDRRLFIYYNIYEGIKTCRNKKAKSTKAILLSFENENKSHKHSRLYYRLYQHCISSFLCKYFNQNNCTLGKVM